MSMIILQLESIAIVHHILELYLLPKMVGYKGVSTFGTENYKACSDGLRMLNYADKIIIISKGAIPSKIHITS